jgi:diguanylate cyclase (GGDEF)-like protein
VLILLGCWVFCRRDGWNRAERRGTATRVVHRVGCVNGRILADERRNLSPVQGVVRESAWDLAGECVDEAVAERATPSLERLGRLGQLGSLPSFIAALGQEEDLASLADDYARERESLGLAPDEIVAELLVLGRVLGRHGEDEARAALERCLVAYVRRVTGELAEHARRDPLTSLLNHRAFHAQLQAEAARARRYRGRIALVTFDLDGFKRVNDGEGHLEGDRLLRAFAAALAGTVRETDFAGRTGGDEFAALLIEAGSETVAAFLARLRERLPTDLSVSAGAACLPEECSAAEQLLAVADRRLYADKKAKAA